MRLSTNNELRLVGTNIDALSFLRGEQWGEETTRQIFQGAVWVFPPNGTFTFQPLLRENARDDLYPIEGFYTGTGTVRTFHGDKHAASGASASLDGVLYLQEESARAEFLYTMGVRKIVKIAQILSPPTQGSTRVTKVNIGGFQIPASFRFSISGSVDGQVFGPLPGTLKILQKSSADPNPFEVQCMTDSLQESGSLAWLSFVHIDNEQSEVISKITLISQGEARSEVEKKQSPLSPSWSTVSRDESLEGFQGPVQAVTGGMVIPATAEHGTLTFTVQGRHLTGWVQATGKSALKQSSTYEAKFTDQEQEIKGNWQDNSMPQERNVDSPIVDFTGTWISDAFTEMQLEQQEVEVTGTYTGRGGGMITGTVQGNLLNFTWHDKEATLDKKGWGFLRLMSNGRTLAGLWGYGEEQTKSESILAELLQRPRPVFEDEQLRQDKIDIKHRGYDLILEGKYEQALPLLKRALALYRTEIQRGGFALDSYLIDEITIQLRLLQCYFELAGYQGVPATLEVAKQQDSFYQELLGYLQGAVDSYRIFLRRTLLARTANPIKELTKTATSLQEWQIQLADQAAVLQQRDTQGADPRIARMLALASILEESCGRMLAARDTLVGIEQHVPGKLESFVQALASLTDQLEQVRARAVNDMERMKALSADWPAEQQEFVQNLVFLLSLLPLKIEGEHRLIAQEVKGAEERVHSTWDSAFNLSQWLERWRTRLLADEAKIKVLNEGQPFFQKLIQFYVDMENGPEALVLSERARARAFADLLAGRASKQGTTEQAVAGYSQEMIDQPITKEEIVQIVQERRSFTMEYFFTETKLVIWTITSAGNITTVVSSVSRSDLESLVNEFSHLVQVTEYSEQKSTRLFELLHQFYYALIAPIVDQLAALPKEEVVTIVPHGQLFLVPYCALRDDQGLYLLEKHALVYAPAIAVLEYTRRNAARVVNGNEPNLLAFVNPINNLVTAEHEFEAITRFYTTARLNTIHRRHEARKEILEQEASNYTVLCFVTHAQAFDERPLDSYLALAPTASDDGRLKVPAIFHLELHADLVILGACETGRGKITGDGVNGVNRAFLAAGTATLLMSLWPVGEDESMNQLYLFHEFWREGGTSKAEALRQAQLEALENHPLQPEVWACFALIGEWS